LQPPEIPPALGTHCRGAVFLDGGWVKTHGSYFGRYDIRTPCVEDFQQGCNFKVLELNGVTSEDIHIYDPRNSLLKAYRSLFAQWRNSF
jgi:hypothetical protein